MNKKVLSISAVASLAFWACTTDNSTTPFNNPITESSSSIQGLSSAENVLGNSSSSQVNVFSSSSIRSGDTNPTANVTCSIQKVSDNVAILDFSNALAETMKMKMTLIGPDVEIESITTYPPSTPKSVVDEMCEESKGSALTLKATVSCEGNIISVKYKDSADFLEKTGQLPKNYIETLKMKKAAELYLPEYSVIQTAHKLGYKDQYHFSRRFKKILGYSPSQIRGMIHSKEN